MEKKKEKTKKQAKPEAKSSEKSSLLCMIALIFGIGLFSTVEITGKVVSSHANIEPFTMVFVRFFVTGIVLLILSLPKYLSNKKLGLKDIGIFALNGIIGIAASITLFHMAIGMFENASSSAVVFSANALFTTILARFINKEKLTVQKCIAVFIGLCGISLFIFEKGTPQLSTLKAIGVMCSSALLFGISVCITRRVVKNYGAMLFMGASSLIGALVTFPIMIVAAMAAENIGITEALRMTTVEQWHEIIKALPSMSYMVFIGTALAYWLYYVGISGVSAFKASMAFFLKPGLACIFAWFYLHNVMNAWTICGTVLLFCAMLMTLKKS